MRGVADLETVIGEAVHDQRMPRKGQIQFQYHRMPILDWTGMDPPPSMESDTLTLPLVPQRDLQRTKTETFHVRTYHPQALALPRSR